MTARDIDDLSVLLGEIKARLKTIEDQQQEERRASERHRTDLRIIIASQSTATQGLGAEVKALTAEVAAMKVLTDDYRTNRDQARGAAKVVLFFRALVITLAAAVGAIATYLGITHGR